MCFVNTIGLISVVLFWLVTFFVECDYNILVKMD